MTTARLQPGNGEDSRAWTREVFAAADYAGVAMYGDPATWQFHAARALLLGDAVSFQALLDTSTPEARLHLAAARWIHGDEARARRELATIDLEHARKLRRLLDQPKIRVLAQLPWADGAMTDLGGGIRHDPRFEVRTIGHRTGDARNRPYASVESFLGDGFVPDFFTTAMVEWHHLPPNLQQLQCPLFGHLADHDLHIQTIRPWLDLFDELCVTDRSEWLDVQGLGKGLVSSFPKVFGLPNGIAPIPVGPRHLDFFVSGTMLDPYHPDKARLLHELLGMPGIDLRVVRGFAGTMAFHALLAASKASFTYVRRPGAMPTRGLESLALGCTIALQQECSLRLWVDERHGVTTYGNEPGDLAKAVRRLLDHHDEFGPAARIGAEVVRAEFAMPRVASQYFRFLTFRAAAPRPARQAVDASSWTQKRMCMSRSWVPDEPSVRRRTMQANFRHLSAQLKKKAKASTLVDMARELLCEFAYYDKIRQCEASERAMLTDAIGLLDKCIRLWPEHLAARFLLVRTLWHHGDAAQRMRALQLAFDTIEGDPARWQIGPHDDVMPFDFHEDCFDFRSYLDLVTHAEKGGAVATIEFARIVLAALAGYVARKTGKPALHELAVAWNPAFARFRLDLAKALLRRGGDTGRTRALGLLGELAEGSSEFATATRLLVNELGEAATRELVGDTSLRAALRMDVDTFDANLRANEVFAVERREAKSAATATPERERGISEAAAIAVLIPLAGNDGELTDLLAELENQNRAACCEVVIATSSALTRHPAAGGFAAVRWVSVPESTSWATRLSACAATSTAPLLTVAMPGDRFRPDAFALLADGLDRRPQAAVAFGTEGWTNGLVGRFEPVSCLGFTCPPPAAHLRLPTKNGIGSHPMWRRSLHDRLGPFDPTYGAAAEYAFWLAALATAEAVQLSTLLSTSPARAAWRHLRDPACDLAAVARARAELAPPSTALPFVAQRPLPCTLLAPGIVEEAQSHARLGILTPAQLLEAVNLDRFLGTALLYGDTSTAACLLRAAATQLPEMLSLRLALANLLDATGLPGSDDVLRAARSCEPYRTVLAQRMRDGSKLEPDSVPEAMQV